ncbi:MAG: hypothetical protein GXN95_02375 [Methanococci archaeon]|nr:hypothetical protein [Methanococci archaeon]
MEAEGKELGRFSGKGVLITPKILERPMIKWEKLEIILYNNKLVFEFVDKKIEVKIEDIIDVGVELPKKVLDIAKATLEDIKYHSSLVVKIEGNGEVIIGFAPETSIYGKAPIDNFLRKLFYILLNEKEAKILYDVKNNENKSWEDGYLTFIEKRIKEEFVVKIERILAVKVKKGREEKIYEVFCNIKDVEIEEMEIDGEIKPVLQILQIKDKRKILSYLCTKDKKVKLFLLRYMITLLNCQHVGILRYLQDR